MPAILLGNFDPEKVVISIGIAGGAQIPIVGVPDGDFITVEKNAEFFNNHIGSRGEVSRATNRDMTGTVTIRLQSTSPSVKYLENLKTVDSVLQIAGIGAPPVMTIKIVDPSTAATVFASSCWLQKDSTKSWGNEVGVYEYTFFCVNVVTAANETLSIVQNIANAIGLL